MKNTGLSFQLNPDIPTKPSKSTSVDRFLAQRIEMSHFIFPGN